ncbi:GNAT family N-acetyltransferase [Metabacillus sp. HB246100]
MTIGKNLKRMGMVSVMRLEEVKEEHLACVKEIVNSNGEYNQLENDQERRTDKEIREEFFNHFSRSFLIKYGEKSIGVIDSLDLNPKDGYPWLGLLMLKKDEQGKGYAKKAYKQYEDRVKQSGQKAIRLAVLTQNDHAKAFWQSLGYEYYETKPHQHNREVDCFEKTL